MKCTILVVEDNPVNLAILEEILISSGHEVRSAMNGESALEAVAAQPPELILLDIMMPDMDGFEVCRRLKEDSATVDIPVLFISALPDTETKLKAFASGGVDYIPKPFARQEVLARVHTHLRLSAAQKELVRMNREMAKEVEWRTAAEKALKESEVRYRAIVEDQTEIISRFHPDGTLTFVNDVFCRFFGKTGLELIGSTWQPEAVEDDIPLIEKMLHSLSPSTPVTSMESRVFSNSGEVRWLQFVSRGLYNTEGQLVEIQSVGRDITEIKHAEEDLHRAYAYNRSLIEANLDPLVTIGPDGRIADANAATEDVTGCCREELIGSDFCDYFTAPEAARSVYMKVFKDGQVRNYPLEIRHRNGGITPVLYNASVYKDEDGNVIGAFAAARDITEQKLAEEVREKLEAQLLQAQKMEAIGLLAGGIAHDFNNILTAIIGYSEVIKMSMDSDSSIRHYVEQIFNSSERAAELTNGLLAFSRKQVMQMKPLNLCTVIQDAKKMLERLVPEDIDFRVSVSDRELVVIADKGQIVQVLMNLLTNAKDAMSAGGILSIEVFSSSMDDKFIHAHGFGEPGNYACISVSDTGHGMDENTCKRIFEPFFTTKEVGKGTGLGMAIIYGIIKQHNGYITVHSEPGKGTTFKIYLSLVAAVMEERYDKQGMEPPAGGTETILLVEDDDAVRDLHRMILERAGYRVITAVDGLEALDRFMAHQAAVDMIITDVVMPKIDGKKLLEEIRKIWTDTKVLFISGYTSDLILERGILENEFNFMAKPVKPSEMLTRVRKILNHD